MWKILSSNKFEKPKRIKKRLKKCKHILPKKVAKREKLYPIHMNNSINSNNHYSLLINKKE